MLFPEPLVYVLVQKYFFRVSLLYVTVILLWIRKKL